MAKARKTDRGTLRTRGKAKIWYLVYRAAGKQVWARLLNQDGKRCGNRAEAEAAAERLTAPLLAGDKAEQLRRAKDALAAAEDRAAELIEAARPRLAIADAWEAFEGDPGRPQSGALTLKDFAQRWGKFAAWAAAAGLKHLEDITPDHAGAFVRTLGQLSPNRFNKIIQTCALVFRVLARRCNGMANPFAAEAVSRKPLATVNRRELSIDELKAVCQAAEGELRTLLAVGLYSGLRLHDAVLLRWDAVNLERGMLSVLPHKTARTGRRLAIPLFPTLRAILEETPAADRKGPIMPGLAARYERDRTSISPLVSKHFAACGLTLHGGTRKSGRAVVELSFHSLRHSFVSLAAAAGVPLAVVQELCGHASPAIQRHYLHLGEAETRRAVESLPDVLALPAGTGTAPDPAEASDRARLHGLADTLPIETIRSLLASMKI